ncbi:hypothetical protein AB0M48_12275 [Lentzea sp. NPDC051208]|uniref:hypothetical protein n=1 Tax=Lentzea sp. NPDC051208 TaxID=3154642 RepID=UPI00343EE0EA
MSEFEDMLLGLERILARSGETMALPELFELRMATATAHELMAAVERGDAPAVEFHTELLEHHVHNAHALKFGVREDTPSSTPPAPPRASACTERDAH